jgi:hypothetical protein
MSLHHDFDPTTVEITDAFPDMEAVTFDLYRDVHKGIRAELFRVTSAAGYLDPASRDHRVALASEVSELMEYLDGHAEVEDQVVEPHVERLLPRVAEQIESDHRAFERRGELLVELAVHAVDATAVAQRGCVHRLYLELAAFASVYLAHQDVEERVIMPALERALGVPAILELHGAILAVIPPEKKMQSWEMMLPAMNQVERIEMLGAMAQTAPPPVFAAAWELAQRVVPRPEVAPLAARLGLEAAS